MRFRFQTNGEHCNQSSYVIKTDGQLPALVHLKRKPTKEILFVYFFHQNWKWVFNFLGFRFPRLNIVINHLTSSKPKANYQCWYIWTSNQQKSIYLFVHFFLPNWKWVFNFFRFRFQTNGEHCNQSSYVIKTEGQLPV